MKMKWKSALVNANFFKATFFTSLVLAPYFTLHAGTQECEFVAKLFIMRHGDGEHIQRGVRVSQLATKPPAHLTDKGINEIEKSAARAMKELGVKRSDFVEVITSPLDRTMETSAVFLDSLSKLSIPTTSSNAGAEQKPDYTYLDSMKMKERSEAERYQYLKNLVQTHKKEIKQDKRVIERDFGNCEGFPIKECGYSIDHPNWQVNRISAESDEKIRVRAHALLKDIKDRQCKNPEKYRGKMIMISTHDVVAEALLGLLGRSKEKFVTGEFKMADFVPPAPVNAEVRPCKWTMVDVTKEQIAPMLDTILKKKIKG
jgi:broad specificity phosphatase PhoE